MKTRLIVICILASASVAWADDAPPVPVTIAENERDQLTDGFEAAQPSPTVAFPPAPVAPPPLPQPFDDPFFDDFPGEPQVSVQQPGATGEQLRREAEMISVIPDRTTGTPRFGNQGIAGSNYQLQQQIRDLSGYVRQLRETRASPPAVDDPTDPTDPWSEWEVQRDQ